jgi:lysophospholipase L1-like esterase
LKLNNNANEGHMNEKGYKLLAKVIYEQGKELGYWQ